jgi:Hemerythrin HHE cation binding domain
MSERENLFRPIHKGIRSMLYELGSRLQSTDFADVSESNRFVTRLRQDLENSRSTCILCLLRAHSGHEERDFFSPMRTHDPDAIDLMMREHGEVARRIREVAKTCDEVLGVTLTGRRIEVGDRLNQEVNDLFAYYLSHLNNEEAVLVPLMWERFTDEQLRTMRARFYDSLPLALFDTWMRWTLPSMNLEELVVLFAGLKQSPEEPRFKDWVRLAERTLDAQRWTGLRERVGLNLS